MVAVRGLLDKLQEVLDLGVVAAGPSEAQWIAEAAPDEETALEMARRRGAGEPLQYVLGTAQFRHLDLDVGPGVFIPRPETELVAERAIELLPPEGVLVDLCTGSGAIALSVAHERRDATVFATEADPSALSWARRNRDRLGLPVELIEGDLFEGLPAELQGKIDVVVANPPYVSTSRRDTMPIDVRDHEPERALYGGGDGLEVTARIAREAPRWLRPSGYLVVEMSETQENAMRSLLDTIGYEDVFIGVDLAEWPRIAAARSPALLPDDVGR